jgi:hypothetical protein
MADKVKLNLEEDLKVLLINLKNQKIYSMMNIKVRRKIYKK